MDFRRDFRKDFQKIFQEFLGILSGILTTEFQGFLEGFLCFFKQSLEIVSIHLSIGCLTNFSKKIKEKRI